MQWYKHDFFRNLVDMHIPNGEGYLEKFDPAVYAANIKRSGASVAYIYGSNCLGLCFFPTEVGIRHQAAERDIFGQTVRECRKLGLDVVGYLNSWGTFVVDKHPQWSTVDLRGNKSRDNSRYGNPCPNNPEYADYFTSLVKEFVSNYGLDGLWIDMVGIWQSVCYCDSCREKFRREYGKELPDPDSATVEDMAEYARFKGRSVAEYATRIRQTALNVNPKLSVSIQAAASVHCPQYVGLNDPAYFRASDYLAGDFNASRESLNMISRMLYKLTENLPFEFMTARCTTLDYHTMNKDVDEILNRAYGSMMYKGAFLFIDAIDPDGEMDASLYDQIAWVKEQLLPYLPYSTDYTEKPIREIAVYYNWDSFTDPKGSAFGMDSESAGIFQKRLTAVSSALSEEGLDYDIISPKNLGELSDYKVLILSSLATISDDEAQAIRQFVRDGGNVYISGLTSLRDDLGAVHNDFLLSDIMNVHYCGTYDVKPNYIAPAVSEPALFGGHSAKYPHMLNERMVKVSCGGEAKVLGTVTLPVSDFSNFRIFSSAISNPPIVQTGEPAIVENRYGEGMVIYSAGLVEMDPHPDNRKLFTGLIRRLRGKADIDLWAPSCVDYTVYKGKDCLKVHLLNSQTLYPPIPIEEIQIGVNLEGKKVRNVRDLTGGTLDWSVSEGYIYIRSDLRVYKLIVVELDS